MGIDTEAVLEAAGTKWNFLPFRPGLVGGHCIGVDPYYLTHKAQAIGYHPEIVLAGRRLNDNMSTYVVSQLVKAMTKSRIQVDESQILGLAYKENCSDLRNTQVINIIEELRDYGCIGAVYDPWAGIEEAQNQYGLKLISSPETSSYDAIVIAVAHHQFSDIDAAAIRSFGKPTHVLYDLKFVLCAAESDLRL